MSDPNQAPELSLKMFQMPASSSSSHHWTEVKNILKIVYYVATVTAEFLFLFFVCLVGLGFFGFFFFFCRLNPLAEGSF